MNDLEETKKLKQVIAEAMERRGFNLESLADASDIPSRYVGAFLDEDFSRLPATPYIKGYLMKIAEVLKIDSDSVWEIYKKETFAQEMKTSGAYDKLPINRFAGGSQRKAAIWWIVGIIVAVGASVFALQGFFGTPELQVISPSVNNFLAVSPSMKISGKIGNSRDKLTVNNEEIFVSEDGFFEKNFSLQPGVNTMEFKVKRFLGEEIQLIRQVVYQPEAGE
jgi:cytoskeletal protein RodZ